MLVEITIYITLFATLFSGAFMATLQSVDALHYLDNKKNLIEAKSFLLSRLDLWLELSNDWYILPNNKLRFNKKNEAGIKSYVLYSENHKLFLSCTNCINDTVVPVSGESLYIDEFLPQITETATSSSRVLTLSINFNNEKYAFSYYEEK